MSVARYVNLSFVAIGLALYIVLGELVGAILNIFGSSTNFQVLGSNFRLAQLIAMVTALGLTIWLRRNDRVYGYAMEVGSELSKVTWPSWKDTKRATLVVLITTAVIAGVLGVLDLVWGALTRLFYS